MVDKIVSAIVTAIVTILMASALLWIVDDSESEADNGTVTITYVCESVLANSTVFPQEVVVECERKNVIDKDPARIL